MASFWGWVQAVSGALGEGWDTSGCGPDHTPCLEMCVLARMHELEFATKRQPSTHAAIPAAGAGDWRQIRLDVSDPVVRPAQCTLLPRALCSCHTGSLRQAMGPDLEPAQVLLGKRPGEALLLVRKWLREACRRDAAPLDPKLRFKSGGPFSVVSAGSHGRLGCMALC